jgi:uncharacterized repeat protein (TIGR01451 family)
VTNPAVAGARCALTDSPNSVATTTTVPAVYTSSLWVRGDRAGAQVELMMREYSGSTLTGSNRAQVLLSTDWQQVAVSYTPANPGGSTLDLTATVYGAAVGTCFVADDASVTVSAPPVETTTGTVTPDTLAFAAQPLGTPSPAQSVTVSNTGAHPLTITGIALSGTNAGAFALDQGSCPADTAVPVGGTCAFSVTFTPATAGPATATATVVGNLANAPLTVTLTGTGAAPQLSANPGELDFGAQTGPTSKAVTVTNSGQITATVTGVRVSGAQALDFAATSDCTTLAPAATCTATVTFTPTASGSRQANLELMGDSNTLLSVLLSGTGQSQLAAIPQTVNLGSTGTGTTTPAKTVTVTNTGTATAVGIHVAIIGTQAGQFAQTNTCTALAPTATCTIAVTFHPTVAGTANASLGISTTDVPNAANVALTGTGLPNADLTLTSINGPGKPASGSTVTYQITATNRGPSATNATVTITLPVGMAYISASRTGCTASGLGGVTVTCPNTALAAGASASVSVTVRVTAASGTKLSLSAAVSATTTYDPSPGNAVRTLNVTVGKP